MTKKGGFFFTWVLLIFTFCSFYNVKWSPKQAEMAKISILAIIFDRINILTSSLLLCATFLVLFQGTDHMTMVKGNLG